MSNSEVQLSKKSGRVWAKCEEEEIVNGGGGGIDPSTIHARAGRTNRSSRQWQPFVEYSSSYCGNYSPQ